MFSYNIVMQHVYFMIWLYLLTHVFQSCQNCAGEFPVVLGRDCAGVVVAVGADVEGFNPGDEVSGLSPPAAEPK